MRGIRGQDERKAPAVSDQLCCSLLIQGVNHLCSYAVEDVGQGGSRLKRNAPVVINSTANCTQVVTVTADPAVLQERI